MPSSHKIRTLKKTLKNPHKLLREVGFGMIWWVSAFQLSVTRYPQGLVALLS